MDLLDIRIIRALRIRAFQGPARAPSDLRPQIVARQVGLSRETVRTRLARLRNEGVLRGFVLVPNLRLFGLATTTYHVMAPGKDKGALVADWRSDADVTTVFDFVGHDLCIEVAHPRGSPPHPDEDVMDADGHPEPRGEPTPLAWRILRILRHDAMLAPEEVAARAGCSTRTARRVVRQLADDDHADVVAVMDPSAISGLVPALFGIKLETDDAQAVVAGFGDHRLSSWRAPGGALWVAAFAESHGALQALADATRKQPGVADVEILIPGRVDVAPGWIDERLAQIA